MEIGQLISDFGFPIVMAVGMGYFVYFVYQTILNKVDPAVEEMKITLKHIRNAKINAEVIQNV